MKSNYLFILILIVSTVFNCNYLFSQKDIFGITQIYPSKQGFIEWTSNHWNNGIDRTIKYASDPYDPTDWTEDHSASSPGFHIDGNGMMTMSGTPRFHINPLRTSKVASQVFTDIEFTAYYRRKGLNGANYGGMIVGMRGSALGHGSSGGNDCEAMCYMGRFRNDGKWDFEKELKHPSTTYYSGSGYNKQDPLWQGKKLPENRWIGMKYILTNINNNTAVRLRLYIDSISDGNPTNGSVWQLVGDIIDDGTNWQGTDISGCTYTNKFMPIVAGGNVFWRTDNDTAQYKMVSIREIEPTLTNIHFPSYTNDKFNIYLSENNIELKILSEENILRIDVISITGQIISTTPNITKTINISSLVSGTYLVMAITKDRVFTKKFVRY